jgi:signal transduction histidine kinase
MRRYSLFHRFYILIVATMVLFAFIGIWMSHTASISLPYPQWVFVFVAISMILSLGAYPYVRGLTARLYRLQQTVSAFGRGDLGIRASIEGQDEIAELAKGFNLTAERIEALVAAHKRLLANTSHELRTPLTRIRLGVELLSDSTDSSRKSELERDLRELDDLLEEILLASRLEALPKLEGAEEQLDLLALIAEECARYDHIEFDYPHTDSDKHAMWLHGNERLLRRLVRNLLENARRHGAPPISLRLHADEEGLELRATDAGPGVAEVDRERVFEPFFRGGNAEENVGSGLGLSLVRQIARRHGGETVCSGRLEGGSEFIVRIPKRPADD